MQRTIEPHELDHVDLSHFRVIQVSDGQHTVVLWEGPLPLGHLSAGKINPSVIDASATLTIRLPNPLDAGRRRDICEHLWSRIGGRRRPAHNAERRVQRL